MDVNVYKTETPILRKKEAMATITEIELYPEEVGKVELFDVEFARQLRTNTDLPKEERDKLKRYLKRCENVNSVKVLYKLGKKVRLDAGRNLGRLCAEGGLSLQCFSRDVRCALAGRYYFDIDVVNAQPTLILQYCEREGLECSALKRYVEMREEILEEMCNNLSIERWEAKEKIISLYFGGSSEGMIPFVVRELAPEARRIVENVSKKNADSLKWLSKQPNCVGKGMAYIFQTEERKVLMAIDRALGKRGRSFDVLIHDGGLVRKKEGETEFPTRLLREVEADIKLETGYVVKLAVKPLETTIEKEGDTEEEYLQRKRQWEESGWKGGIYFKLRNPPSFIQLTNHSMEQLSKADIIQNEENNILSSGEPFLKKWLVDPTMKEYQEVVFLPKKEAPEGCFNIFRCFDVEPIEGDFSTFTEVLRLIANGDERVFDYIENYFASIIQKPYDRTNISIVVVGEQGVGKDTYFDSVGEILGAEYYHSTPTPENDIFAKFNSSLARKLVVKFEEANFRTNKDNADKLKSLITMSKVNIEKKGKDPIKLDNLTNIIMTTNHDVPVVLEETDRRFVLVMASSERRGDTAFWHRIHRGPNNIHHPTTLAAYHHYLLHKDISTFDLQRDRPITQLYKDVKQSFVPYHARFFQRFIERADESIEGNEWSAHSLFQSMKDSAPLGLQLSETRFGRDIRIYTDDGCLTKVRARNGNQYNGNLNRIKELLVRRNWWIDY